MILIDALDTIFADSIEYLESARGSLLQPVAAGAQTMIDVLLDDGKILACGNGGSAADVLHFTGEMLNRFRRERPPLAAIALNSDVATLTAIGNDYSFDEVFSKQVKALGSASDLLFAITTSGNSANLLAAVDAAHERNMKVLVLSGRDGGELARRLDPQTDQEIRVAGDSTARIQEVQQVIIHGLCELIDNYFLGTP